MTVYKTLYELVQLCFYRKVFCMIVVPVPKFRMRKVSEWVSEWVGGWVGG